MSSSPTSDTKSLLCTEESETSQDLTKTWEETYDPFKPKPKSEGAQQKNLSQKVNASLRLSRWKWAASDQAKFEKLNSQLKKLNDQLESLLGDSWGRTTGIVIGRMNENLHQHDLSIQTNTARINEIRAHYKADVLLGQQTLSAINNMQQTLIEASQRLDQTQEKLTDRFEKIQEKFEMIKERFGDRMESIQEKFEKMKEKFDDRVEKMDEKLSKIEEKHDDQFEEMEKELDKIAEKLESRFEKIEKKLSELHRAY